jgi:hypothetical protein
MNPYCIHIRKFLPVVCWCLAASAVNLGCRDPKLSWRYVDKAPEQVAQARRVAFVNRVTATDKKPTTVAESDLVGAITAELLSRNYRVATQEAGADLVLEFLTQCTQQMVTSTTSIPIPLMHKSHTTSEWREQIHRITLNIVSPEDRSIVGMATVEYPKPREMVGDTVKDVLLGLDMIRRGRPPSTVELGGKPGEAR